MAHAPPKLVNYISVSQQTHLQALYCHLTQFITARTDREHKNSICTLTFNKHCHYCFKLCKSCITSNIVDILQACVGELSLQKAPFSLVSSGSPRHAECWISWKWLDRTVFTLEIVSSRASFPDTREAKYNFALRKYPTGHNHS